MFVDDEDRYRFLKLMDATREKFDIEWRMYVLMKSHVHAMVKTPHGNISEAMRHLLSQYAQAWNRRHRRHGQLMRGRFKSPLIEDGWYARTVIRYIAMNPVKANYVERAADWPWASHPALARLAAPPDFLELDWLRMYFDGATLADCRRQYRRYIEASSNDPIVEVDQVFNGSEDGARAVRDLIGRTMHTIYVPRAYRALGRPGLRELFAAVEAGAEDRNQTILRAQVVYGYTQAEIARALGLHPNTISKVTSRFRRHHMFKNVA